MSGGWNGLRCRRPSARITTYNNFVALHELLEQVFGRRVDLVTDKSLSETKARLILPTVRYAALHD